MGCEGRMKARTNDGVMNCDAFCRATRRGRSKSQSGGARKRRPNSGAGARIGA